jgi:calmodulin
MSADLTEDQRKEFRIAFNLFDKNSDGAITVQELGSVMRTLGQTPTEAELLQIISQVDTDGDGTIDFEEFVELMKNKMKGLDAEEEIREAFKVFDKNGDGYVEVAELRQVVQGLGEPLSEADLQEMIKEADADGDGRISYQEFVRLMASTK